MEMFFTSHKILLTEKKNLYLERGGHSSMWGEEKSNFNNVVLVLLCLAHCISVH